MARQVSFLRASNGDLLAVDLEASGQPVCYLDHDHEEFHGRVLAASFHEFMARWARLHYVGPEWWVLQPFTDGEGLAPDGPVAQEWREWLESSGERAA